jgi:hypothetical protein
MGGIQIVIQFDPAAGMKVQGPLENPVVMLGLLELAKVTCIKNMETAQNRVQLAPPGTIVPKVE